MSLAIPRLHLIINNNYRSCVFALIAIASGFSITMLSTEVIAADDLATGTETDIGDRGNRFDFDIAAGPMNTVLRRFASIAGITLSFNPAQAQGLNGKGIQGNYTVDEALAILLAGTQLRVGRTASGGYIVTSPGTNDGPLVLPPIKVSATTIKEFAYGPVDGYLATRSATATKTDTPIIETPQSVSVVTADQIEFQNTESIAQAFKYNTGVQSNRGGYATDDSLMIRGFDVSRLAQMYLNGTKISRNTYSAVTEPYAMERIELLKGPASVLYGNAAPGGIINRVMKLPRSEPLREIKVQGGSFERRQVAGDFAGKLAADDTWTYRLTGLMRRSDTSIDNIPDDRNFSAASIRWQPSAKSSLTLLANYQHNETAYMDGLPAQGTVLPNINGDIKRDRFIGEPGFDKFEVTNQTLGYLFRHQFTDSVVFRQNLLYFDAETNWNAIGNQGLDSSQRLLSRRPQTRNDDDLSWTLDNQVEIKWQRGVVEHTTLLGVDYTQSEFERLQFRGAVAPLDLFAPQYGAPVTLNTERRSNWRENTDQRGVYVQEHMKIDKQWVLMLGGRYDQIEAKDKDIPTNRTETTFDDDAFTGRIGAVRLFDNGLAPYVSYAESFEPVSGRDVSGSAFEPARGEQYEAGIRYQPEEAEVSVSASVYQLTQTNVTTTDLANPDFSVQQGEVESNGAELEFHAQLNNELNLIGSMGYINNKVTKSNSGEQGNRLGGLPRHTAALWADYRVTPLLLLGAGISYFGESRDSSNSVDVPDFTTVDAAVQYQLARQWQIALNISNVFDKRYATCTFACFYGAPRSAQMTLTYRWQ